MSSFPRWNRPHDLCRSYRNKKYPAPEFIQCWVFSFLLGPNLPSDQLHLVVRRC